MKHRIFIRRVSRAAVIGALYVILTMISHIFGLDSGMLPFGIQCRISEARCLLPLFAPEAVAGLTVGCLIANLLVGGLWQDIVFGTLATLFGAIAARLLRRFVFLVPIPNILSNTLIIPLVLRYVYAAEEALPFLYLSIGLSELLSSGVLGIGLLLLLRRYALRLFPRFKNPNEKGEKS